VLNCNTTPVLLALRMESVMVVRGTRSAHALVPLSQKLRYGDKVELTPIGKLKAGPRNPRTHSKRQITQLADSIKQFGFPNPIITDEGNTVLAGYGRLKAAELLGLSVIPTIRIGYLSDASKKAYRIADNRLAELAGWDRELLAIEFQELNALNFDTEVTGFATAEVDLLIDEATEARRDADLEDLIPSPTSGPAVTQPGDLWSLGGHLLFCGDARLDESYLALLQGEKAELVFADPPYNVRVRGNVTGLGKVQHREFAMASGEMSRDQFTEFLETIFKNITTHTVDGAISFVCMDWRHMSEIMAAGRAQYSELKNVCVWAKTNAGMGTFYRSAHELVFVFKTGTAPHINNFELGQHGRSSTCGAASDPEVQDLRRPGVAASTPAYLTRRRPRGSRRGAPRLRAAKKPSAETRMEACGCGAPRRDALRARGPEALSSPMQDARCRISLVWVRAEIRSAALRQIRSSRYMLDKLSDRIDVQ